MLFYSYAELVVGLIAVFYFTSKIFVIAKYKLYFILSLLVVIITASISMFIDEEQKNGVLLFLHFVALTFMPVTLGYSKKMMLILSSLFFSGLTFFIFEISQLLCSILKLDLTSQKSAVFSLISNLIVFGMFIILSSPLKIKTKLVVESITKPTIIMILIFLYLGGSMATFGTYYIIPSSDYRTIALKILTLIVSIVFSFSIPILLYNQIKKSRYMYENTDSDFWSSVKKLIDDSPQIQLDEAFSNFGTGLISSGIMPVAALVVAVAIILFFAGKRVYFSILRYRSWHTEDVAKNLLIYLEIRSRRWEKKDAAYAGLVMPGERLHYLAARDSELPFEETGLEELFERCCFSSYKPTPEEYKKLLNWIKKLT